ncbi:hypothetical protein HBI71_162150 [Parastagonospora nodorum]|nr:hypothetical protein HBI71_162150 [Parastagonospora nodorum]
MTAPAQSYFASVNAQNTAACKAISTPVSSGLSDGAKAGIGVGIPVALAVIGGIVYLLIKAGIIGGATAASTSAPAWSGVVGAGGAGGASAAGNTAPAWSGVTGTGGGGSSAPAWSGVTGGESSWNGVAGSAHAPPPAHPMSNIPPVLIAGALRRSSSSERVNTTYHQSSPVHLPTPGYQCQPPLRSVSPPESYQNRQQPVRHASELSADGASSPRTELSAISAYYGHEMYSAQRHEAPTRDEEHPRELPAYRHY